MDFYRLALRLVVVHHPPLTKVNRHHISAFLDDEWFTFLTKYATTHKDILIVGDFHPDVKDYRDA